MESGEAVFGGNMRDINLLFRRYRLSGIVTLWLCSNCWQRNGTKYNLTG